MKSTNGSGKHFIAVALVAAIIMLATLSSCEDFFGTADLKESIRGEVAVATADNVPLTVRPDPDVPGGTTSLSTTTQKVGVPFDISATVFAEYAFTGWSEPSGTGAVTFATTTEPFTTATITEAADGIIIQANFTRRPELEASDPFNYAESVFKNKTILLYFSKPMDPSTVNFATISIRHKPYGSSEPAVSIADRYQDPAPATGNLLFRLELMPGETLSETHIVTLRISRTVTDEDGHEMAKDAVITFIVSNQADSVPPSWEDTNPFIVQRMDGTTMADLDGTNSRNLILRPRGFDNDIVVKLLVSEDGFTTISAEETYASEVLYSLQTLSDGPVTLSAHLEDATGLWTSVDNPAPTGEDDLYTLDPQEITIFYDTVPPGVPSIASSNSPYESAGTYFYATGGVEFNFSSSDATSGVSGYTTSSGGSSPEDPLIVTTSGTVYAVDNAGNVSNGLAVTVEQDNSDPVITDNGVTSPGGSWAVANDTFEISFGVNESGSGLNGMPTVSVSTNSVDHGGVSVNDLGSGDYSASVTLSSGDPNGLIEYTISATDNVGNAASVGPVNSGVELDTEGPTTGTVSVEKSAGGTIPYVAALAAYATNVRPITLDFTTSDNLSSSLTVVITDDQSDVLYNGSYNGSGMDVTLRNDQGAQQLSIVVTDEAGNSSGTTTVDLFYDNVKPTLPQIGPAHNSPYVDGSTYYYETTGVDLDLSSTDTGGSLVAGFTTDSGGSNPQDPLIVTTSGTVYAVDNAGNVSNGLAVTVEQDNSDPVITDNGVTSPGGSWAVANDTFEISFGVNESGSGLNGMPTVSVSTNSVDHGGVSVNDLGSGDYSASVTLSSGDPNGLIEYTISATDNVGNAASVGPVNSGVELDTEGPTTGTVSVEKSAGGTIPYVAALAAYATNVRPITLDFTTSDNLSSSLTVVITDDQSDVLYNGSYNGSGMDVTLRNDQGAQQLSIVVTDEAGNSSGTTTVDLFYDNVKPTLPQIGPAHNSPYVDGSTYYYETTGVDLDLSSTDTGGSLVAGFTTDSGGSNPQDPLIVTTSGTVYAVDNAGNVSNGLAVTVEQDNSDPVITDNGVTSPGGSWAVANDTFEISFGVNESGSGLNGMPTVSVSTNSVDHSGVSVNDLGSGDYSASVTLSSGDPNGLIEYTISATDNVGNAASVGPVNSGVELDTEGPTISAVGGTLVATATQITEFVVTDAGIGVDTGTFASDIGTFNGTSLTGLVALTDPSTESYVLSVDDLAGNTGTRTVVRSLSAGTYSAYFNP